MQSVCFSHLYPFIMIYIPIAYSYMLRNHWLENTNSINVHTGIQSIRKHNSCLDPVHGWVLKLGEMSKFHKVNVGWGPSSLAKLVYNYNRRKFRSQTSDNMDRWKAEQGRGREKRKIRRKKSKKKEDAGARKGRKVAKHCVFPMIWGSGGSKSQLAKAAGAEPAGQMRDEKLHAVVAQSTFRSQNVQNTSASDHFWKLRCRKSARRCGAKHISKSKCTKHLSVGPLLEVAMSKKCTPLWREAHFEVKMYKTHQLRTTFVSWDVEKVHAVVAQSTFRSQNVKNTRGSDHFWRFGCRKSARRCGAKHISKSKC